MTATPRSALDRDEWHTQLLASARRAARERDELAAARRDRAARRKTGMVARHAWRQARLDARAADADRPPPPTSAGRHLAVHGDVGIDGRTDRRTSGSVGPAT